MPDVKAAFGNMIGTEKPDQIDVKVYGITPLKGKGRVELDLLIGDDGQFSIPENLYFHRRYMRLFSEGMYRIARKEEGDRPGECLTRVYFSGGINFSSVEVECIFHPSQERPESEG